jgi:hypothetical protein
MDRRFFLRSFSVVGASVAATSFLSSCETSTDSTGDNGGFEADAALVTSGAEFEAMGVKTYQAAANSGLLSTQAVIDTALAYMADHQGHLDDLNNLLKSFGNAEVDISTADPDPGVGSVTNETDVIKLALDVEFRAATFYFSGIVNEIKSTEARRVFANILPVETAHFMTYKNVLATLKGESQFLPAIDGSIFEELSSGL